MTTIQELDIQMRRTGQCFSEYLRMAESFRLVRESSATEKISPASSLYENVSKTDRGPAVKRERIRPDRESEDRTEWSVQTGNKKW